MGLAINWAALQDKVGGVVLVDFLSGNSLAGPDEPAYNPDQAKELLAEAGYPDGFDAMLFFDRTDELAASLAELVTGYLYDVKIYAKYLSVASADARTEFATTIAAGERGLLIERR
jgi:ABC-type transport system substrate-binding protein